MVCIGGYKVSVGDKSVIFLIGAGCSYEAGIPMSNTMIDDIEGKLVRNEDWNTYRDLYEYVKHTIEYGNKRNKNTQDFNIESLLVTLHALAEHRKSILYPFISGYANDLIEYAGRDFKKINELINKIEIELPKWITQPNYQSADYYIGFSRFQKESNYTVRIFSLNYDLCVESQITEGVESGFELGKPWDRSRFTHTVDEEPDAPIYLYKLHGSIDWKRENNIVVRSQQQGIKPDIVFGTNDKIQAVDPYLFYLYEFRRYALAAKIIVIIGYSFNDSHVNNLLKQSLEEDETRRLLIINPSITDSTFIVKKIGIINTAQSMSQIIVLPVGAKEFLTSILSVEYISKKLPNDELPF